LNSALDLKLRKGKAKVMPPSHFASMVILIVGMIGVAVVFDAPLLGLFLWGAATWLAHRVISKTRNRGDF